jgi:hypothetical protein
LQEKHSSARFQEAVLDSSSSLSLLLFTRMLWLNPTGNQGVRSELSDVKEGEVWHE